MKRSLLTLLACLALTVLVAACGGDDEEETAGGGATTTESPDTATTDDGATSGDTVTIRMKDIQFQPDEVTVKVGQTVRWVNEDTVEHDAVDEEGGAFESELFGKDGSFEYTPEEAGEISYVCTVHPSMTGKLIVTE